jgi:hypothetical protein
MQECNRYDVKIFLYDHYPAFGLVGRIIGVGGENLRAITSGVGAAKARLRGRGSGYCERRCGNAEAPVPLMLCVSSVQTTDQSTYCMMIERAVVMLKAKQGQYEEWCHRNKKELKLPLFAFGKCHGAIMDTMQVHFKEYNVPLPPVPVLNLAASLIAGTCASENVVSGDRRAPRATSGRCEAPESAGDDVVARLAGGSSVRVSPGNGWWWLEAGRQQNAQKEGVRRYVVKIHLYDHYPAFALVGKIVGVGGENLKAITFGVEFAKARVRGRGSGYCERRCGNAEAPVPLMLCVSSVQTTDLWTHCKMIERAVVMLKAQQVQYEKWCHRNKKEVTLPLFALGKCHGVIGDTLEVYLKEYNLPLVPVPVLDLLSALTLDARVSESGRCEVTRESGGDGMVAKLAEASTGNAWLWLEAGRQYKEGRQEGLRYFEAVINVSIESYLNGDDGTDGVDTAMVGLL